MPRGGIPYILLIDEEQAEVVRTIFDLYLSGLCIVLIIQEIEKRNIKSPQGKNTWSKHSIQKILTNEKYIGFVLLGKTCTGNFLNNKQRINCGDQEQFMMKDAHEPIIELEKFEQVEEEMKCRNNIEIVFGKAKRKGTHYSSKREKHD